MLSPIHSGGGIAGLCLAVALSKYSDIELNVYEAAESFKEVGAGVMVWGRTWTVLSRLGIDKAMRAAAQLPANSSEGSLSQLMFSVRIFVVLTDM